MSGAPIINGTNQFPNPPIIIGITMKKIMTKACAVTTTLYSWSSSINLPECDNSLRITNLNPLPNNALQPPKMKYNVPMSL